MNGVNLTRKQRIETVARGVALVLQGEEKPEKVKRLEEQDAEDRATAFLVAEGLVEIWDGMSGVRPFDPDEAEEAPQP